MTTKPLGGGRFIDLRARLPLAARALGRCAVVALGLAATASLGCSSPTAAPSAVSASASATAAASAAPAMDEKHLFALNVPDPVQTNADRTVERMAKLVKSNPEKVDGWIGLGQAWVQKAREASDPGFYLNAQACADIALGLAPEDRSALNLGAIVKLNAHQFKEALSTAEHILAIDKDNAPALGTKSDALLELGSYDEAVAAADQMNSLKPNLPSYARVGYLRWVRGDMAGALPVMKAALDSGRGSQDKEPYAWTMVQTSNMFWARGDYDGAIAGLNDTLKLVVDYPPALVAKARYALMKGEFAHAAELLEIAFKAAPLVETGWLLGDARTKAGDAKKAEEAYASAIQIGQKTDKLTLSRFYAAKNREIDKAIDLIEEEAKTRGGVYIEDARAWALYRKGRFADAKIAADKAIALGTPEPRFYYHAGAIEIALGNADAGKKLVQKALDMSPQFDLFEADDARQLVKP